MTQDKARKRAARQRAAETGESYTRAARQVAEAGRPPACFDNSPDPDGVLPRSSWAQLTERLDEAEARLNDEDPYTRAAAFVARAYIYDQLAAQTTDPVYTAACVRAAICDQRTAADIRWKNGIPTLRPRSEVYLLGLGTCSWCERPWQADPTGACEHCPRLLFGPPPATAAEASRLPAPQVVDWARLADPHPVDD